MRYPGRKPIPGPGYKPVATGHRAGDPLFRLKLRLGNTGLPNNRPKRAAFEFIVIGHGHGDSSVGTDFLHDNMASALTHLGESMSLQDPADFGAGEDAKPTQSRPPAA